MVCGFFLFGDYYFMQRIALGISYFGASYFGWQSQLCKRTVQDKLEYALNKFSQQRISVICAGRTDSGVHALMQVVHFDTSLQRDITSWVRGVNAFLPTDIAVQWARIVPNTFHARRSAKARRYVYIVLESPVRPSLEHERVGWVFRELDKKKMQDAALRLLGEHDFSSFRASECQALSPIKNMQHISIQKYGNYWRFEFQANAFLHHMVRNIMGCLVAVGQGKYPPSWIDSVLEACDRNVAAPTFSASGLYFAAPVYDGTWGLPTETPAFAWLPAAKLA